MQGGKSRECWEGTARNTERKILKGKVNQGTCFLKMTIKYKHV